MTNLTTIRPVGYSLALDLNEEPNPHEEDILKYLADVEWLENQDNPNMEQSLRHAYGVRTVRGLKEKTVHLKHMGHCYNCNRPLPAGSWARRRGQVVIQCALCRPKQGELL